MDIKLKSILSFLLVFMLATSCNDVKQSEKILVHFIDRHVEQIKPIDKKLNQSIWMTYTGQNSFSELLEESQKTDSLYKNIASPPEYYQKLLNNVYDNASDFEMLKKLRNSELIQDPLLNKQLDILFKHFMNVNSESDDVEHKQTVLLDKFYELKKNEGALLDSLKQSKKSNVRSKWVQHFSVIADDYKSLVIALNKYSEQFGYENYFQMALDFAGLEASEIETFVAEIERKTRGDYEYLLHLAKEEISALYNISGDEITSDYYRSVLGRIAIPDEWYKSFNEDTLIRKLGDYFAMSGFSTGVLNEQSDIWYKKDKINQAFFFCADASTKDYRIYANVNPDTYGLQVLLHELGHLVHFKYVSDEIPYLLKEPSNIITEAVAAYFDSKIYYSPTLRSMIGISSEPSLPYYGDFTNPTRLYQLRNLSRNLMFEKSVFENPEQDYTKLWWDLTQKYMLYDTKPDNRLPEWVTNRHIIYASIVNANYLYAYAIAAQLENYFPDNNIEPLHQFIKHGNAKHWNELLKTATGEELNINYLINSYKKEPLTLKQ